MIAIKGNLKRNLKHEKVVRKENLKRNKSLKKI